MHSAPSGAPALVRSPVRLVLLLALAVALARPSRAEDPTVAGPDAETARLLHLLRRATFGPTPADLEEARRLGAEAWVDRQLHPETIADRAAEKRLEGFSSLDLSTTDYWQMLSQARPEMEVVGPGEDRTEAARRRQREANRLRNLGYDEVPQAVLLRAAYSRRQLEQVMLEFWRNHFNVDRSKNDVRYYLPDWEREVLGKHVFGRFEDFLVATARHPAMLYYLDNHVSRAPAARGERVLTGREREDRTEGLNENYARELMELHTVGVDNGYDQDDVIQLALVFTGWTIDQGTARGAFRFDPGAHAKGRKRVMGKTLRGEGVDEGEAALRYLASHENTRAFLCRKLVSFLVADEPPPAIVASAEETWRKTRGDLRAVTRSILLHEDFAAPEHIGTKAKTPLEFVVGTLRAVGADVTDGRALLGRLDTMYQPIYSCEDPTGYSDAARDWMDPGVLAVRWQFAYDLLHGRIGGVDVASSPVLLRVRQDPEMWEELLVGDLFAGDSPGPLTMRPFRKRILEVRREFRSMRPEERLAQLKILATLLLGSAEFQRQ